MCGKLCGFIAAAFLAAPVSAQEARPVSVDLPALTGKWEGRLGCGKKTYRTSLSLASGGRYHLSYEAHPAGGGGAAEEGWIDITPSSDTPGFFALNMSVPSGLSLPVQSLDASLRLAPKDGWLEGDVQAGGLLDSLFGLSLRLKIAKDRGRVDYFVSPRFMQDVDQCRGIAVRPSRKRESEAASVEFPCPAGLVPALGGGQGNWRCRAPPTFKAGPSKNPNDPCPEGLWWHASLESCTPVLCTTVVNEKAVEAGCPPGHHVHKGLSPRPIECVGTYAPENAKLMAERPRMPGECNLCTNPNHDPHRKVLLHSPVVRREAPPGPDGRCPAGMTLRKKRDPDGADVCVEDAARKMSGEPKSP